MQRRRLLAGSALAAAASLGLIVQRHAASADEIFEVVKTDAEWRALLTPAQYAVLREHGTERPESSPLEFEHRAGIYACAGCDLALFRSEDKFESGTGWPSFTQPIKGRVGETEDRSFFMRRTEVHCARCGGHLGHVFDDGPEPTGLRYCMNGVAMTFHAGATAS